MLVPFFGVGRVAGIVEVLRFGWNLEVGRGTPVGTDQFD